MDCNETHRLLEAHLDEELDLVRHAEIEAHVRTCVACARLLTNTAERRAALREKLPRFNAPTHLAAKIRASLPPSAALPQASRTPTRASKKMATFWQIGGLAAGFAAVLFAGFQWGEARARTNLVFDEAIADHVRSLQVDHLTDVASTDQHTVKPWFVGKLDFSPPVIDLAADGFPLTGGRLEHVDGGSAAALVFHRRQHAINVFIWPATRIALPARKMQRDGYEAESWSERGMNFLAVSDISPDELAQFSAKFRAQNSAR
jgi:anti-sigma factor RsiW